MKYFPYIYNIKLKVMKKLIIVFSLITSNIFSQQYEIPTMTSISVDRDLSVQIYNNINEHRDSINQESFKWNEDLYKQSKNFALNLIRNSKWGHWGDPANYTFELLNMFDISMSNLQNSKSYDIGAYCVKGWANSNCHRGSLESPIKTNTRDTAQIDWCGIMGSQILATDISTCAFHVTATNGQQFVMVICRSL